ncbi:hypothetical protein ACWEHA_35710 [Amycolatopsis nivea]
MPRKETPAPETVTVEFEGAGTEAYEAIAAEHGPKLAALADKLADPAEAARLRELAEMLPRLSAESRYLWAPLILDRADDARQAAWKVGRPYRDELKAMADAVNTAYAADRRAASDSVQVNRALAILAVRRPAACAALAAALSGPAIDPAAEEC